MTGPELRHSHGSTSHYHEGGGEPHEHDPGYSALGKGGWVWEGLSEAGRGIGSALAKILLLVVVGIVALFLIRWGYTEYWISQHCTMVLGTRVCQ